MAKLSVIKKTRIQANAESLWEFFYLYVIRNSLQKNSDSFYLTKLLSLQDVHGNYFRGNSSICT